MQKKFLTNLGLILLLNFLVKPFYIFGIDRTIQNVVGADYGFYFAVFNFSFLFNILLDVGITNFNNRNIAQNSQLLNKHFSNIIVLRLILAVFFAIVTLSVAAIIGYSSKQFYLLGFLIFNQFLISLILYLRSNISGLLLFRTDSFMSVLDRILMIAICGVLLWGNVTKSDFQIEWFVYAQTVAYALTALTALGIVIKKAAFKKLSWNWPFFILIIRKSFPFALLTLLMTFYNRIDSVLIERLLPDQLGNEQTTVYASAFRLLDAINMIAFLFAVLLLPIFSRMIKNKEAVDHMVKLAFSILITVAVTVAFASCFYSKEIMNLLYVDHQMESARVFSVIMFGFVAISCSYIFGTLLTANGNLLQLNIIAGSSMLLSFILNFILIPKYLAVGSAYASVSAQFISAIAQIITVQLIFKFKVNYRLLLKVLLFVAGVFVIAFATHNYLTFSWIYRLLLMGVLSLVLSLMLRLLSIRGFIAILRGEK